MSLPKEHKKAMKEAYGNLSEELFIFLKCLKKAGFEPDEAMTLLCTIVGRPDNMLGEYRHKALKPEVIKKFREITKDRKEKLNGNIQD